MKNYFKLDLKLMNPVFHSGELYLQGLLGEENVKHAYDLGSSKIKKKISKELQYFISQRHMTFVTSWNEETREVWMTPLFSQPEKKNMFESFEYTDHKYVRVSLCKTYDPCHVTPTMLSFKEEHQFPYFQKMVDFKSDEIVKIKSVPPKGDPLWNNCKKGSWISLNFLEPATRKRLRTNGVVTKDISEEGFEYESIEVFTTCPKYIQQRIKDKILPKKEIKVTESKEVLTKELVEIIEISDTFFIGTVDPKVGADSSHRGGRPGFCRVIENKILCWGDYVGKNMFQTLGNTVHNPSIGLLFVDFINGHCLQLEGTLSIQKTENGLDHTSRNCVFTLKKWRYTENLSPFQWKLISFSSHNPVLQDRKVQINSHSVEVHSKKNYTYNNNVRIVNIKNESENIKTFEVLLENKITINPGQYGTFCFEFDNNYTQRSWTISSATYLMLRDSKFGEKALETNRIEFSVKLKPNGNITPKLFNDFQFNSIYFLGNEGGFTLDASEFILSQYHKSKEDRKNWWKVLFISAGIGITPMISMARGLLHSIKEKGMKETPSIIWYHSSTNLETLAFIKDLQEFKDFKIDLHFTLTRSSQEDQKKLKDLFPKSEIFNSRINEDHLKQVCSDINERVCYICGPDGFMRNIVCLLDKFGVPDNFIISESFEY